MSNSNKPGEQPKSKGVLMFARNSKLDYMRIAQHNCGLIKEHLQLPVAVITDTKTRDESDTTMFDHVIMDNTEDTNKRVFYFNGESLSTPWINGSRSDAYDLTPFDRTLLLDADYLIMSNNYKKLFDLDIEFTCHYSVLDVTGQNLYKADKRLNSYTIPMVWATAVLFDKCNFSENVFTMMKLVKEHWEYYSSLYQFNRKVFRNDFALSIALHILGGYGTNTYSIPWALPTLTSRAKIIDYNERGIKYVYEKQKRNYVGRVRQDIHIMDKKSLVDFI
jgi:hypothetical protein